MFKSDYQYFMTRTHIAVRNTPKQDSYLLEICKKIITYYGNLKMCYQKCYLLSNYKHATPILRLLALLCFNYINLVVSIKNKDQRNQLKYEVNIELIEENILKNSK